mmetsp:Transcript_36863/g.115384  ORF Transcript_36863/g.115384 Transcript_36863/m.115384 type:complete len:259 (-) Transcript_36863:956-1732(-)
MVDDSFGAILGDIIGAAGAAASLAGGAAAGRGGIGGFLNDLVEYLESGVGDATSVEFQDFLRSGSTAEIAAEFESAELLKRELDLKIRTVRRDERRASADLQAHKARTTGFTMEDLDEEADLEERQEGLRRRLQVMEKHMRRAEARDALLREELARRRAGGGPAPSPGRVPPTSSYRSPSSASPPPSPSPPPYSYSYPSSQPAPSPSPAPAAARSPRPSSPRPSSGQRYRLPHDLKKAQLEESVDDELKKMKRDMGLD